MDEIEVPLEQAQEHIHEAAHHEGHTGMNSLAAVMSAFLAVVAAVSALFAGHFANEAMIEQIQSSDKWAYYQAKGIKLAIAQLHQETAPSEETKAKIEQYQEDQKEIQAQAEEKEAESRVFLRKHETLAAAVTFFQVAIAITAIAILTRRRNFLGLSVTLGIIGIVVAALGFLRG